MISYINIPFEFEKRIVVLFRQILTKRVLFYSLRLKDKRNARRRFRFEKEMMATQWQAKKYTYIHKTD